MRTVLPRNLPGEHPGGHRLQPQPYARFAIGYRLEFVPAGGRDIFSRLLHPRNPHPICNGRRRGRTLFSRDDRLCGERVHRARDRLDRLQNDSNGKVHEQTAMEHHHHSVVSIGSDHRPDRLHLLAHGDNGYPH